MCDMTPAPSEAISVLDLKRVGTSSAARFHLQSDFTLTITMATMWTQLRVSYFSTVFPATWPDFG